MTGCTRSRPAAPTATPRRSPSASAASRATRTSRASTCGSGPARLEQPLRWKRPRMIFVNSMSDLFHEDVPDEFIAAGVRRHGSRPSSTPSRCSRSATSASPSSRLSCRGLTNVWMGVAIENRRFVHRADYLREVPAAVRFISAEPLLGPLEGLDLDGIDWLIAGGESGARHRPMRRDWVRELRDRCLPRASRSSSSSGAGAPRRPAAASCKAAPGTRCPKRACANSCSLSRGTALLFPAGSRPAAAARFPARPVAAPPAAG